MTTTSNMRKVFRVLQRSWLVISDIAVKRLNLGIRNSPLNKSYVKFCVHFCTCVNKMHFAFRLAKRKLFNHMRTPCLFMWVRWWYFRNKLCGCIVIQWQWNSFFDDILIFIRLFPIGNFTLSLRMSAYIKVPIPIATVLYSGILHRLSLISVL